MLNTFDVSAHFSFSDQTCNYSEFLSFTLSHNVKEAGLLSAGGLVGLIKPRQLEEVQVSIPTGSTLGSTLLIRNPFNYISTIAPVSEFIITNKILNRLAACSPVGLGAMQVRGWKVVGGRKLRQSGL